MKNRTKEEKQAYIESLIAASKLVSEDAVQAFLAHTAVKYSASNAMLILAQNPEASAVAGFKQWIQAGRVVRKGQKGLAIFVPVAKKDDNNESVLKGFRIGYVFDISQTEELEEAK